MINFKLNKNKLTIIFILIVGFLSLFRIYVGSNLQLWFVTTAHCDDLLLINYADLVGHFTNWNFESLVKNMSYSLFLSFVKFSGIPYSICLSILWVIAALLVLYVVYKFLTKNKIVLLFSFIFILFAPIGFDIATGLRIYRHAIMAPITLISLTALFIFLNYTLKKFNWITVVWGVIAGFTFSFNYYIKEDGITFLPILIVTVFAALIYNIFKTYKSSKKFNIFNFLKIIVACLLPLIVFAGLTIGYEQVNNHYFGVSEINTRSGGELGNFYHNLLKIDDGNKTKEILVPPSTIEKAWNASSTLKSHPELFNHWMHTPWAAGNLYENPLPGDLIMWSLRGTLSDVGLFNNEKSVNEFFKQVNSELEKSFEDGSLNKSDEIFITDSLNGKNMDEISELKTPFIDGLKINLFYEYVRAVQQPVDTEADITSQLVSNDMTRFAESFLNEKIHTNKELHTSQRNAIHFAELDIMVYQYISYIIVLLTIVGFVGLIINQFKNRFKDKNLNMLLIFEIMLIGTFLVQIFAIAWFTSWINQPPIDRMEYYTAGCQGLFALFEILAICGGFKILKKLGEVKNKN